MAYTITICDTALIYGDKTVSLNGVRVGRVDRETYESAYKNNKSFTFHPLISIKEGYGEPVELNFPTYVSRIPGSVDDWKVNPVFTLFLSVNFGGEN